MKNLFNRFVRLFKNRGTGLNANGSRYYGGGFSLANYKKILRPALSLGLFVLIISVSSFNNPFSMIFREKMLYYISNESSDLSPKIVEAIREGVWMDSFEKGVLQTVLKEDRQEELSKGEAMAIPVSGNIVREYGWEESSDGKRLLHPGIDIASAAPQAQIRAALKGRVKTTDESQRLGKFVELDHGGNLVTIYGNCSEITVQEEQIVEQGDVLGTLSSDANTFLHFEVREKGQPIDPMGKLAEGNHSNIDE
ncbi:MAG: M23 family metallopeptidase [Clostridia bacterium]|nr:M23 family metallopeptidase [Clostridia bacterium]